MAYLYQVVTYCKSGGGSHPGSEKSVVLAGGPSEAASVWSGQSEVPMSQNRHSSRLGALAGGDLAASRRSRVPRSVMNWFGGLPWGARVVWVGYMTSRAILESRYCGSALGRARTRKS